MVALNGLISEAVKLLETDRELREQLQKGSGISWWMNFKIPTIAQLQLLELLASWPKALWR